MLKSVATVMWSGALCLCAHAQGSSNFGAAFNAICLGSQLRSAMIKPLAELYANQEKTNISQLPLEKMRMINPDYKIGFGIGNNRGALIVGYGEKAIPGFTSLSCTVTSPTFTYEEAKNFVRTNFKVSAPNETRQADSQIAMYFADLIGFGGMKTGIAIQSNASIGFTSIMLMSMPP